MKMFVVNRKIILSILIGIGLIWGLSGVISADAATVSPGDDDTELKLRFTDSFGPLETKAYQVQARRKTPQGTWKSGCVEISNDSVFSDSSARVTITLFDLKPGTTYQIRYRTADDALFGCDFFGFFDFGPWSRILEGTTSGGSAESTPKQVSDPDVVVEASKSNLAPGESFTLTAIFKNSSTRRSSPRTVRYYRSALNDREINIEVGTDVMESIDPGDTSRKEIVLTPPEVPGTYYYGACIDTTCAIGITITVVAQLPDLAIESPQASMSRLTPGKSFTLTVPVRNNGNGQSSSTTLRYYRAPNSSFTPGNTEEIGTAVVDSLDSNATDDVSIVLTAPEALGTYYYRACIDSVPNESHINNNCSTAVNITVHPAPKALVISSGNDQDGTPNSELTAPLVVQVLDADNNGIANVRVTFRVTAGQGKFKFNRRSSTVLTNSRGFAEAPFTPTSAGSITIQASVATIDPVMFTVTAGELPAKLVKVSGDPQSGQPGTRLANPFVVEVQDKDSTPMEGISVTFRITAGGGTLSATTGTTGANGRAQTFLTLGSTRAVNTVQASVTGINTPVTFRTSIEPKVLIAADQRPPMYWVNADAGTLHRLVGAKVENLLPSVQNATGLIMDAAGGKLYWTEKTSDYTGKIQKSNLDGSTVELVKDLTSVPLYITLDAASGKLYLINSYGKLQRMNVDGSNFQTNLITGLSAPKGLAVDAAGGKVYWIEQTGERTGTIRRANLDGTESELIKDLTAVPQGIALDTTAGKVYITNAWGKVQRLNLDGSQYESNLITGLKSPMDLAVDSAGGKVYWMEEGHLRRADLNGENVADVVTSLGASASLVLGTMPAQQTVAAAPAGVSVSSQKTVLLANYPNPFNPETWIPYQLSKPADVTLTIYGVNGQMVRQLSLGHQAAGIYHSRSRAAYWDGRNAFGEPVASGLYFYTLTAGDFSATRKLLIRK